MPRSFLPPRAQAPELFRADPADSSVDIYALGIMVGAYGDGGLGTVMRRILFVGAFLPFSVSLRQ